MSREALPSTAAEQSAFRAGRQRWIAYATLLEVIGVKSTSLGAVRREFPEFPKCINGKIDGIAACECLAKGSTRTAVGQSIVTSATEILKNFKSSPSRQTLAARKDADPTPAAPVRAPTPEPVAAPKRMVKPPEELGLGASAALERMRVTEKQLNDLYIEQLDANDSNAQTTFRMWKDLVDQLRKMEAEIFSIEKAKGSMIDMAEMKALIQSFVAPVRSKLMAMPAQVAEELAGRDAIEVQEILETEIRKLLGELSKWTPET